jgi:hypothetical protein
VTVLGGAVVLAGIYLTTTGSSGAEPGQSGSERQKQPNG